VPFYEIEYETGRMSVANYEDDAQAEAAIGEQNRRALVGEPNGPNGGPAERIKKVYVYSKHPDSYNEGQTMSADVATKEVGDLIESLKDENGVVSITQLAEAVGGLSHPFVISKQPFESSYKMEHDKELDLAFLDKGA